MFMYNPIKALNSFYSVVESTTSSLCTGVISSANKLVEGVSSAVTTVKSGVAFAAHNVAEGIDNLLPGETSTGKVVDASKNFASATANAAHVGFNAGVLAVDCGATGVAAGVGIGVAYVGTAAMHVFNSIAFLGSYVTSFMSMSGPVTSSFNAITVATGSSVYAQTALIFLSAHPEAIPAIGAAAGLVLAAPYIIDAVGRIANIATNSYEAAKHTAFGVADVAQAGVLTVKEGAKAVEHICTTKTPEEAEENILVNLEDSMLCSSKIDGCKDFYVDHVMPPLEVDINLLGSSIQEAAAAA
jgi:hypothetical protein